MERHQAARMMRDELNAYGLTDWGVRLNQNADSHFLGLCSYKDKCIILSAHHIDIHPDPDVVNTIKHELAHALVGPGHAHDEVWEAKAREVGCDNTRPCSNLALSPEIIDAIRSGADVEVTFDEQVIRTPKYTVTRLQDKCAVCGKVAKVKTEKLQIVKGDTKPNLKFITLECGHMTIRKIPKGTPFHKFHLNGSHDCPHNWDKNNCIQCQRKRPYDFQVEGMRQAESALSAGNGILIADEMGLGKTIQAMGVVYFHKEWWPVLWIVKSGLKYQFASALINWMNPVGTKTEDMHIPQIVNTSKDWLIPGLKHYIIGYDMLVQKSRTLKSGKVVTSGFDITQFERIGVKLVILDECQQIKNADSSRTQMVRRVCKGRKVIGLSGTPWNNRGSELFPILNMIAPSKFWSADAFKRQWVATYMQGAMVKEGGIKHITQFREYTQGIIIRRERKEVMSELPSVNRTKLNVVMSPFEEAIYDEAVEEFVKWFEEQQEAMTGMAIIAMMAKLRHLCALAKIPATEEYVDEFVEDTDRKLVVFAHHQDVQYLLYESFKNKYDTGKEDGVPVLKLDADMNGLQRHEVQERFNSLPRCILVASQLASGEGLNLQTCSDCVMHERQWNPGKEEQCESRFIRIGQLSDRVDAVYTHMEGLTAIDQNLDAIIERKRAQFHNWTGTEAEKWSEEAIMKELAVSIVRAHKQKRGGDTAQSA